MLDYLPNLILLLLALYVLMTLGYVAFTYVKARQFERKVPPRGAFTTISTGRLHYLDCGEGPAILMIHGLAGNLGHFDCGMIDDLARDFRVVAIDRPGSGHSDRAEDGPANIRAQARQVAEVIQRLELDNPLVVGHSLGGAIALALALEKPDLVRGLALLAPLTLPMKEVPGAFSGYDVRSDFYRKVLSWTTAVPHMLRHPEPVRQQVFGPDEIPPEFPVRGGGLLAIRPKGYYHASVDFRASADDLPAMAREYARLAVPVRVLFGREDRILDHEHHGEVLVRRHPQIGLKLIEGGHMLPVTRPEDCISFVRTAAEAMKDRKFISRASPEVYR
ncbi:Alpha/beta hydrolase fold [Pseudooceanicola batsensis HTCC2597]|uniref:Alpha/beta hydrolase fold n=1 Tax=Pseudooceanicola batsensis (strain ATCC BAA-863 / DSM 15984 / KCTC 12145 / HTCC2597) TaxID=252305 RepID=A3U2U7_PSEBH|nr:alpha/beta hydrolase [Pseudooceanicola batsensis]EAQ01477.1 Alpha/beta hydrolase fold [Pseudooceanicola batsensis HTCC2597]